MKTLTILRHAKTEPHRPGDFDRALVDRGIADAQTMGKRAREADLRFDYALASPARRTTQTIELFRKAYGEAMPLPEFNPRIYDASLAELMNVVRDLPDSADHVILCGHNPAMHAIVLALAQGPEPLLAKVREKFPTAAMATLTCDIAEWSQLARDCATLVSFDTPKHAVD